MTRLHALLPLFIALLGCKTPGETIIGRGNGQDVIASEADIQARADQSGISRTQAIRELRREHEMRLAVDMQKEWKSKNGVHVEGAKIRTQTDEPDAPDSEKIEEFIAQTRTSRAELTAEIQEEGEEDEESDDLEMTEDEAKLNDLNSAVDRIGLPEQKAVFEESERSEGWKLLPDEGSPITQTREVERQGQKNPRTQTRRRQANTAQEKTRP
jgi:hypothetical protein